MTVVYECLQYNTADYPATCRVLFRRMFDWADSVRLLLYGQVWSDTKQGNHIAKPAPKQNNYCFVMPAAYGWL